MSCASAEFFFSARERDGVRGVCYTLFLKGCLYAAFGCLGFRSSSHPTFEQEPQETTPPPQKGPTKRLVVWCCQRTCSVLLPGTSKSQLDNMFLVTFLLKLW